MSVLRGQFGRTGAAKFGKSSTAAALAAVGAGDKRPVVAIEISVELPRFHGGTAARAEFQNLHQQRPSIERHRQDVADRKRLGRIGIPLPIHPNETVGHELCRGGPGFYETCEPQPLVEPLSVRTHQARAYFFSSSSCALRASSLANGESGSGSFSRRSGGFSRRLSKRLSGRGPRRSSGLPGPRGGLFWGRGPSACASRRSGR